MTPQELSSLDYEGASEMLLACATDAKKYEKEIASLKSQAQDWRDKAAMAQARASADLASAGTASPDSAAPGTAPADFATAKPAMTNLTAANLAAAALQRATELDAKAQELSVELEGIRRDIRDLREALPLIKAKQRRVDPDQLLAELSMLVGNLDDGATPTEPAPEKSAGGNSGGTAGASNGAVAKEQISKNADTPPGAESRDSTGTSPASPTSQPNVSDPAIDDALAALKRKMGLL